MPLGEAREAHGMTSRIAQGGYTLLQFENPVLASVNKVLVL